MLNSDTGGICKTAEFVYFHRPYNEKTGGSIKSERDFSLIRDLNTKTKDFDKKLIALPNHERLVVIVKDKGEDYERSGITIVDISEPPKKKSIGKHHLLLTQKEMGEDFIKSLSLPKNYLISVLIKNGGKEIALMSV